MVLSDIRRSAREALSGKWGKGALIILAYLGFSFALSFVTSLLSFISIIIQIATIVISIPISFGLIASFIKLKRGEEVNAFDFVTYGFNNFARSWKIAGNILLKMWLPILLYVLATMAFTFALSMGLIGGLALGSDSFFFTTIFVGFALLIPAFIYLFVKSLLYMLAYLVAYDNEEMSAKEAVEESKKLMIGNRGKFVLLQLSFIGWIILSAFTLYIGLFWLIPYIQVAMICFYEALKDNKVEE